MTPLLTQAADRREAAPLAEGGTFVLGPNGTKVRVPERGAVEHDDPAISGPAKAQLATAQAAADEHAAEQRGAWSAHTSDDAA